MSAGKKPLLKEADGSDETGCKLQNSVGANGGITLASGMLIQYACRNVTMKAFAEALGSMRGAPLTTPVVDRTNLSGIWNFDIKWSLAITRLNSSEQISLADAIEKQLGLKLEKVPVPAAVIVVDSVDRKPSSNPPGVADALPPQPPATEFEVADLRLAGSDKSRPMRFQTLPGGRLVVQGIALTNLVNQALGAHSPDDIAGLPDWANRLQIDITAKAPVEALTGQFVDPDTLAIMLRALLVERFGLMWRTEQRLVPAYTLIAPRPKLKKADPESRIFCKVAPPSPEIPPNSQVLQCQNASMDLFAKRLQNLTPGMNRPVTNDTGLAGSWDFSLVYSLLPAAMLRPAPRPDNAADSPPAAPDPAGGYTIPESVEKQLGLKLEIRKRLLPVIVIDHLNQNPADN